MGDDAPEDILIVHTTDDQGMHWTGFIGDNHFIAVSDAGETVVLLPVDGEIPEIPEDA